MYYKTKMGFLFLIMIGGLFQPTKAFFPFVLPLLIPQKKEKNLILVLDVKQQEHYLGACGYTLAVGLKDKVSPIITSSHALSFVRSYFKPEEWFIYKNSNLILFIPKNYLTTHNLKNPKNVGFSLQEWDEINLPYGNITGSEFYTLLKPESVEFLTFEDLSRKSTVLLSQTFQKNKNNRWKIYAVGHGAPDSSQVCGLNLQDFKILLDFFEKDIATDFFIYQTCFGGSKNQLREIYKINNDLFKKFSFPIISGSLTNSVSFSSHPNSGITFNGIFSKVNNSIIVEKKTECLLKAINELNKCLDLASNYHWSNNLLLVRMPNSQYFEPVADNKSVFKLSDLSSINVQQDTYEDKKSFKCFLVDKPIIDNSLDLSELNNFMIASGISRSKHFIKEIKLSVSTTNPEICLPNILEIFNSLACPEKEKTFYIETITADKNIYKNIMIMQKPLNNYYSMNQKLNIKAISNDCLYQGEVLFEPGLNGKPRQIMSDIKIGDKQEAQRYNRGYQVAVHKHLHKKHLLPFGYSIT